MKLIQLNQIVDVENVKGMFTVTELWLNKDIFRWAHTCKTKSGLFYTKLTLIADDKPLNILETPEEINNLCNFIQEVKVHGLDEYEDGITGAGTDN